MHLISTYSAVCIWTHEINLLHLSNVIMLYVGNQKLHDVWPLSSTPRDILGGVDTERIVGRAPNPFPQSERVQAVTEELHVVT